MSKDGVHRPITLGKCARTASGLVGIAGLGVGGWATMASANQAGSAVILVLGGLFSLMALSGRVPDRISKDGIDYESVLEKAVEDVLESGSATTKVEVGAAIGRAQADSDPRTIHLLRLARHVSVERQVLHALNGIGDEVQIGTDNTNRAVDAIVRLNGRTVGVDVKVAHRGGLERRTYAQAAALARSPGIDHLVLVAIRPHNEEEVRDVREALDRYGVRDDVTIVQLQLGRLGELLDADLESVRSAVTAALR